MPPARPVQRGGSNAQVSAGECGHAGDRWVDGRGLRPGAGSADTAEPGAGWVRNGAAGVAAGRSQQQQQQAGTSTAGPRRQPDAGHHRRSLQRLRGQRIRGRLYLDRQPHRGACHLQPGQYQSPSAANVLVGNIPGGSVKLMPQQISSYARLFAGMDGMAANGLRYGAGMEIRQNFIGQYSNNGSSGASGYSSYETMFVRRAFTYAAGENWGIFRLGQADGLISLFDLGVTTFQFLPSGNLNGGDATNLPGSFPSFVYLAVAGNEYANAKAVYLSPQIAGFDFGIQYAPNTSNDEGF